MPNIYITLWNVDFWVIVIWTFLAGLGLGTALNNAAMSSWMFWSMIAASVALLGCALGLFRLAR